MNQLSQRLCQLVNALGTAARTMQSGELALNHANAKYSSLWTLSLVAIDRHLFRKRGVGPTSTTLAFRLIGNSKNRFARWVFNCAGHNFQGMLTTSEALS